MNVQSSSWMLSSHRPPPPPQASVYDLYDMTSLAADELGDESGNNRRKAGSVSDEMLDTERLAWCTRILNQVGCRKRTGESASRKPGRQVLGYVLEGRSMMSCTGCH